MTLNSLPRLVAGQWLNLTPWAFESGYEMARLSLGTRACGHWETAYLRPHEDLQLGDWSKSSHEFREGEVSLKISVSYDCLAEK